MPNDFTPLTHEELRELWDAHNHYRDKDSSNCYRCRLILTAIWWESMAASFTDEWSFTHSDKVARNFLAKLREVGIEWREDG